MNILINASNLKTGGGLQVADSVCVYLNKFQQHKFTVVLSCFLDTTAKRIENYNNVTVVRHNITNSLKTLLFGRDKVLDNIVENCNIDCVLTIFGPSRWNPKVPHVSGFAMPHLVFQNSPYFKSLNFYEYLKYKAYYGLVYWAFRRSTKVFYSENSYVSEILNRKWKDSKVYTVTNYYNQIFDHPEKWIPYKLSAFDGITILTVSANYPHKNLKIAFDIARYIRTTNPDLSFRFVFTVSPDDLEIPEDIKEHFVLTGKVDISECPSLYQQADIMFQPSLLDCFTANYPEAMRMGVPIVTTNLEFAKGLCGEAALYFSAVNYMEAAEKIIEVSKNENLKKELINAGYEQLKKFDTYDSRADKLINLCENFINKEIS